MINRRMRALFELALTIAVAVGLAFAVQALAVKPYKIPSGSMLPTLDLGQRILVNRLVNHPSVGDIVVFHPPAGANSEPSICADPDQGSGHSQACDTPTRQPSSQTFVKRVVAGPGDVIRIIHGHVYRNGVRERDSYAVACGTSSECEFSTPIRIPRGDYFMMGDNRPDSDDSRFWGPVPNAWIIGVAFFSYWPPDRIGSL